MPKGAELIRFGAVSLVVKDRIRSYSFWSHSICGKFTSVSSDSVRAKIGVKIDPATVDLAMIVGFVRFAFIPQEKYWAFAERIIPGRRRGEACQHNGRLACFN